ncbi:hypothetical protein T4D_4532 [Trichinella pseudospiralis]|uniref:Uncharacterized protein n=1 Tax=Trichinella pseudospiralis TaxID=6337 RepID=A0A0V1F7N6_TRIPS|nr:hypothetical protein T4D_4532 [Trichinella pseudospiralis]
MILVVKSIAGTIIDFELCSWNGNVARHNSSGRCTDHSIKTNRQLQPGISYFDVTYDRFAYSETSLWLPPNKGAQQL